MSEKRKVWFWNPNTRKIFTDSICSDKGSSYYNELVIECGPTQLSVHMNDDHTMECEEYDLYGINTKGMLWADSEEELQELLKRPKGPNSPKEDWEVEDDFRKRHHVNGDTKCCGNCKHCDVWHNEASCVHPELDYTDRFGKKYNIKMEVDMMTVCDAWERKEAE